MSEKGPKFEREPQPEGKEGWPLDQVTPTFPGHEQFDSQAAIYIQLFIDDINATHQDNLRDLCAANGVGWKPDGFLDEEGIDIVLQELNRRETVLLAGVTAAMLQQTVGPEVRSGFSRAILGQGLDQIPSAVFNYFNNPQE
jgi:hypothetical protein